MGPARPGPDRIPGKRDSEPTAACRTFSTLIPPAWASMTPFAIASPSPAPRVRRARARAGSPADVEHSLQVARRCRRTRRSRSALSARPAARATTEDRAAGPVWRTALPTRLVKARDSSSLLPWTASRSPSRRRPHRGRPRRRRVSAILAGDVVHHLDEADQGGGPRWLLRQPGVEPGQLEQVVDERAHPVRPSGASGAARPAGRSITSSSSPSASARSPASGVRRSCDMKATSSRRLCSRARSRSREARSWTGSPPARWPARSARRGPRTGARRRIRAYRLIGRRGWPTARAGPR